MPGLGILRLSMLLGGLGLGLYGAVAIYGQGDGVQRQGRMEAAAIASRAETAPEVQSLPPAVRRLADSPVEEGPSYPVVIGEARPLPVAVAAAAPALSEGGDWRSVRVNSANVRGGPSTAHAVVARVTRGEEVEIVATADGWAHIRIQGDGVDGWIAERLLTP